MHDDIGRVLKERYEIIEQIGEGGMALVYRAKDRVLNRFVAIKILRREHLDDESFVKKFEKESQSAARLSHANIVNVFDVGREGDTHFIVMELIEGITLKQYLKKKAGRLSSAEILEIYRQVAMAIAHAHRNKIIHRDIKAQNILITGEGIVKVADFGIARAVNTSTIINTREVMGSVHYSSPEQVKGHFVDEKSDIYSLGVLLYELSTGVLPFTGDTQVAIAMKHVNDLVVPAKRLNKNLHPAIDTIIERSLRKNPAERYTSVDEILSYLKSVDLNDPVTTAAVTPMENTTRQLPLVEGENMSARKQKKTKKKENTHFVNLALVIFAALFLAAIVFIVVSFDQITDRLSNELVTVPDVINRPVDEATDRLENIGLRVETEERFSDTIEDNHVISQSHAEGESLKSGYVITLTVSKGAQLIKVPTIRQKTITEAEIILENAGLVIGEATYTFSELPEGYIVEQSPEAGRDMSEGGRVDVVVSEGPEASVVLMPGLVDKTVEEAEDLLEPLNLLIGEIVYRSSPDHGIDVIMEQAIAAGAEIEEGERIDLVVSSDEEVGETVETPTEDQEPGGITRTYVIPLNFEEESAVVRVEKIEASGISEIVYENSHLKSEENIRVQVTAQGRVTINFYYDERLVSTKVETFE